MRKLSQYIDEAIKDQDKGILDMLEFFAKNTSGVQQEMYKQKVGDKIKIVYNPDNPNEISQPSNMILNICLLVGGIAALVGGIVSAINAVKKHKKMKKQEEAWENGK